MKRAFLDTSDGQIHYVVEGEGEPLILLHQTPRSIDEYREVIPILARRRRVIAMDTIGYGDSDKPPREYTIQEFAQTVILLMDSLSIRKAILVGHHTGAFIAIEVAASYPERVKKLVLSSPSYVDERERQRRGYGAIFEKRRLRIKADGSHLTFWWNFLKKKMPTLSPQLLHKATLDYLKAGETGEDGHLACSKYCMEKRLPLIKCPTLVIIGTEDAVTSLENKRRVAKSIPKAKEALIEGGTYLLPNQLPEEFAKTIEEFLEPVCLVQ